MVIEKSVTIKADRDRVWDTFLNTSGWVDWQGAVRDVQCMGGKLCLGGSFSFRIKPFLLPLRIEAHVDELVPGKKISWSGGRLGIRAKHVFTFKRSDGGTYVVSRETFMGPPLLLKLLSVFIRRLSALSARMLKDLKDVSEAG